MLNKPCCIDIYQGDDVSDNPTSLAGLDRVKADGIFALIHKATEGVGERDSRYDARRTKWMSGPPISVTDTDGAKLSLAPLWGAYHFLHGGDPVAEARNFLMTARLSPTDMAFLDWEAVGASGHQPSLEAADAFCQTVEASLGRSCGVYGGNVPRERFAAEKASDAVLERFSERPLWLCAYVTYNEAKLDQLIPEPWAASKAIWLWQDDGDRYGPGPHTIPGIARYCDNSTVVGDMTYARLHAEWLNVAVKPKAIEPSDDVEVATIQTAGGNVPIVGHYTGGQDQDQAKPETPLEKLRDEMKHLEQEIEKELHRGS